MKVKEIDGQIVYASNFMKIGDNWVSNPTDEHLQGEGYFEQVIEVINEEIPEEIPEEIQE